MARTGRPKTELVLRVEERAALEGWVRRRSVPQAWALRCRIILACAAGATNKDVTARLDSTPHAVGRWRARFVKYRIAGLGDMLRPGCSRTVTDEQVAEVVAKTLERTSKNTTHWSTRSMAQEVGLSQSTVSRIWRAFGLQPHRSETLKLSTDPYFFDKVHDVVGLYLDPPERTPATDDLQSARCRRRQKMGRQLMGVPIGCLSNAQAIGYGFRPEELCRLGRTVPYDLRVPDAHVDAGALPAGPGQRIKSPLLSYQISALAISLCRFVRDSADSDAGSCRQMTGRSAASEHPPSTHGRRCIGPVPSRSVTVRETLGNNISAGGCRPVAKRASDGCPFPVIGRERWVHQGGEGHHMPGCLRPGPESNTARTEDPPPRLLAGPIGGEYSAPHKPQRPRSQALTGLLNPTGAAGGLDDDSLSVLPPCIGCTSSPHRPRPRSLPPASGAVRSPDPTRHRVILGGDRR
jgi:transposase